MPWSVSGNAAHRPETVAHRVPPAPDAHVALDVKPRSEIVGARQHQDLAGHAVAGIKRRSGRLGKRVDRCLNRRAVRRLHRASAVVGGGTQNDRVVEPRPDRAGRIAVALRVAHHRGTLGRAPPLSRSMASVVAPSDAAPTKSDGRPSASNPISRLARSAAGRARPRRRHQNGTRSVRDTSSISCWIRMVTRSRAPLRISGRTRPWFVS